MDQNHVKQILQVASLVQKEMKELGSPQTPDLEKTSVLFDALITEAVLRDTTRQLFLDGHYALAVEEAYKCLNNIVKSRSRLTADGADLMRTAFTPKNPVLRLNALKTESQRNQQQGYMDIFAGCMIGIRNPRAHEHHYLDEPHIALEMLSLANHLFRLIRNARRSRSVRAR